MKACPDCGASNPEGSQLCGGCGRSLFFFEAGTVLSDRYEIQEILGAGGLGRVYRAHDRMLDETVAVKVLHPESSASSDFARRFRSEDRLQDFSHGFVSSRWRRVPRARLPACAGPAAGPDSSGRASRGTRGRRRRRGR